MPDGRSVPGAEVTRLLRRASDGEVEAWDTVFRLVYDELRQAAGRQLAREGVGHTLQPTALVNEAYVRLVRSPPESSTDREHFVSVAARAMRQVLVDYARARSAGKRGGGIIAETLDGCRAPASHQTADPIDIIALDGALDRLDTVDSRLRKVVELRYFGGMADHEIAALLGMTRRTVLRDWARARAWLYRELAVVELQADA